MGLYNKVFIMSLIEACLENDLQKVLDLLSSGEIGLDLQDELGCTALGWASVNSREEIAQALIYAGANLDIQDNDGDTPLNLACFGGHIDTALALISNGAKLNLQNTDGDIFTEKRGFLRFERTPLTRASVSNLKEVVSVLISNGAKLDLQDNRGDTALIIASRIGYKELVTTLIYGGASLDLQNNKGETPLSVASQNRNNDVVMVLLSNGADWDTPDRNAFFYGSVNPSTLDFGRRVMAAIPRNGDFINNLYFPVDTSSNVRSIIKTWKQTPRSLKFTVLQIIKKDIYVPKLLLKYNSFDKEVSNKI